MTARTSPEAARVSVRLPAATLEALAELDPSAAPAVAVRHVLEAVAADDNLRRAVWGLLHRCPVPVSGTTNNPRKQPHGPKA